MSSNPQLHAPERSIFAVDPIDEFATIVGDWIWNYAKGKPNIEIEGKIGSIIDTETGQRIQLPVRNETIIDMPRTRFESKMTTSQHASYNRLLNNLVSRSNEPGFSGAKLSYERRKEIDYLHSTPSGKVRVTRDADTLQIKPNGIIQKQRIADLNVHCPQRAFDYRISISVEAPAKEPTSDYSSIREKNRLSYSHQNFVVDLTQVIIPDKPQDPIHELEIEFKDVDQLLQAKSYHLDSASSATTNGSAFSTFPAAQEWTPYDDQVLIFLNNLRLLIRNASSPDERRS